METLILKAKILALRDLEIALKEAKLEGSIIPDIVFEILKKVEDVYIKDGELATEAKRLIQSND